MTAKLTLAGRLRRLMRRAAGWHDCPCCGEQSLRCVTDNPIHPDGPPMFVWWSCHACGRQTEPAGSPIFDSVSRDYGYPSFVGFLKAKGAWGAGDEEGSQPSRPSDGEVTLGEAKGTTEQNPSVASSTHPPKDQP